MQIRVGSMWSGLESLLDKMWVVGFRAITMNCFIDIGQAKLSVFWINRSRREDSNKNMGVLGLCRGED